MVCRGWEGFNRKLSPKSFGEFGDKCCSSIRDNGLGKTKIWEDLLDVVLNEIDRFIRGFAGNEYFELSEEVYNDQDCVEFIR